MKYDAGCRRTRRRRRRRTVLQVCHWCILGEIAIKPTQWFQYEDVLLTEELIETSLPGGQRSEVKSPGDVPAALQ